jgi:hypothetical protein
MIDHDFVPTPFYHDRCDMKLDQDGRLVLCGAPVLDHRNGPVALRSMYHAEAQRAANLRLERVEAKLRAALQLLAARPGGMIPRVKVLLMEAKDLCGSSSK